MSGNGTTASFFLGGFSSSTQNNFQIIIDRNNIALNSVQQLISFTYNQIQLDPVSAPVDDALRNEKRPVEVPLVKETFVGEKLVV